MQRVVLASVVCAAAQGFNATTPVTVSEAFLGSWTPVNRTTPHAIIGPSGLMAAFTMTKDDKTGDYWMSAIQGQVFRIRGSLMQYCFARVASSPFVVAESTANKIQFCQPDGVRMHSHKNMADGSKAYGCDAANIQLQLHDDGLLELTFYMSPPVKHAWVLLKRRGPAPPLAYYTVADMFGSCDPLAPPPPTLLGASKQGPSLCPIVHKKKQEQEQAALSATAAVNRYVQCRQLGTFMAEILTTESVNIRLQWTQPIGSCWPCKVSYSVSAAIEEDKYISVGFKGMAYRFYEGMIPGSHKGDERPNYFGMMTDPIDETRTGSVMVGAFMKGGAGCVRQMKATHYVGAPTTVEGNPNIFDYEVERQNGRTILRFAVEQYVGKNELQIRNFYDLEQQAMRMMWAIGDVKGDDCQATMAMHDGGRRGLSPLAWFDQHPRCLGDAEELLGARVANVTMV